MFINSRIPYFLVVLLVGLSVFHQSLAQNILINGNFSSGNLYWNHYAQNGAVAQYTLLNDAAGKDTALNVNVTALGTNNWDAQSIHSGLVVIKDSVYTLTFKARSARANPRIRVILHDSIYRSSDFILDTVWRSYSWRVTAPENGTKLKLHYFQLGEMVFADFKVIGREFQYQTGLPDSLKHYANRLGLTIGAAINPYLVDFDSRYQAVFTQQFNGVVAENVMKMTTLYPDSNGFDFSEADRLMQIAARNNMTVRGHTLLWHQGLPAWFTSTTFSNDSLRRFMKRYVKTVVGRYKGKIAEWDVINELISDAPGNPIRLFNVTQQLGSAIIDSVFIWAHEADTSAKLFYNDYSIELGSAKTTAVYNLMATLRQRGVPVHGVGFQCHFEHNYSQTVYNQVEQTVQLFRALGMRVSFTEIDKAIRMPLLSGAYQAQAQNYGRLLKIALKYPSTVKNFTLWGFTDAHSWIPDFWANQGIAKDDALIFTREYQPKPAYDTLLAVLKSAVLTNTPQDLSKSSLVILGNPSASEFHIIKSGIHTTAEPIRIIDALGREQYSGILERSLSLGSHWPKGLYLLQHHNRTYRLLKN